MELEPASLATSAVRADERALAFVAHPHRALDRRRHMPSARRDSGPHLRAACGGAPRSLELFDQHRRCPLDDEGRIAGGQRVAQQIAGPVKVGPPLGAQGDLEEAAIQGQRGQDSAWGRGGVRWRGRVRCHDRARWRSRALDGGDRRGIRRWQFQARVRICRGRVLVADRVGINRGDRLPPSLASYAPTVWMSASSCASSVTTCFSGAFLNVARSAVWRPADRLAGVIRPGQFVRGAHEIWRAVMTSSLEKPSVRAVADNGHGGEP